MDTKKGVSCLLGAILIVIGESLIMSWGQINIYYFSYFKANQPDLQLQTNSEAFLILLFPSVGLVLYSEKIANCVGLKTLIRWTCSIQFVSLLLAPFMQSYVEFLVYYLAALMLGFSIIAYPLMIAVWSNFYDDQTQQFLSYFIFGIHALSHIGFSYLVPHYFNPRDSHPTEQLQNSFTKFKYYNAQIAENFHSGICWICLIAGLSIFFGSLLMTPQTNYIHKKKINPLIYLLDNLFIEDDIYEKDEGKIGLIPKIFDFKYLFITICYTILMTLILTITNYFKFYAITNFQSDHKVTKINFISDLCKLLSHFPWLIAFQKLKYQTIFTSIMMICGTFALLNFHLSQNIIVFSISYIFFMMIDKGIKMLMGSKLENALTEGQRIELKPYLIWGLLTSRFLTDIISLNLKTINFYEIIQYQGALIIGLLLIFKASNYNGYLIMQNIY